MYAKKRNLKGYQSALSTRRVRCLLGLHDLKLFTLYGELGEVVSTIRFDIRDYEISKMKTELERLKNYFKEK